MRRTNRDERMFKPNIIEEPRARARFLPRTKTSDSCASASTCWRWWTPLPV